MSRVFNFGAGPAQLPEEVLRQVQDELLDWNQLGMSVLEVSHRSAEFMQLAQESEQDLRDLLTIPDNYQVLFLHGGGRSQFAMVPLNLAKDAHCTAYTNTGSWSNFAIKEAERYSKVNIAASAVENQFTEIPDESHWDIPVDAAYLHCTDNETIQGLEFNHVPNVNGLPLVTDMSSNLLTKPVDVSQYGLIYACAQKNLGPAGTTIVIIRDDLLAREPMEFTPTMFNYQTHAEKHSLYNTPCTFSWYVVSLILKWVKKQGGLEKMDAHCRSRSQPLYDYIDQSDLYTSRVKPKFRSRVNVVFTLVDAELDQVFLQESKQQGLANLKGHRSVGGMRASMYNAMSQAGADALLDFMRDFEKRH